MVLDNGIQILLHRGYGKRFVYMYTQENVYLLLIYSLGITIHWQDVVEKGAFIVPRLI
jgi:hypothetical protein